MWKPIGLLLLLGVFSATAAHGDPGLMATTKEATSFQGRKATVLVFLYTDCPIANKMAPELARLEAAYHPKGMRFFRVYAGKDLDESDLRAHGEAYGLKFPAVIDEDLALVKLTGATVTPEAVVFDATGARRYRGRINDRFVELGVARRQATRHDLRDALDAVIAGRAVAHPETKAVGCYLPLVEQEAPEQPADAESGGSDEEGK